MSRARVLIGGYYGHGNLGDEALLGATLEGLRRLTSSIGVTVASGNPAESAAMHGVEAVHERDWPALVEAAKHSDVIVLGGGGLFQDYFGIDERTLLSRTHWGLTYFAAFPALAALAGRPFLLHAVGVGPLGSDAGRRFTRLIFERASAATVRDAASLDVLKACGVDTSRVTLAADPAFLLDGASAQRGRDLLQAGGVPGSGGPLVALAVRCWTAGPPTALWQASVADALDRLVDASGARVVFVPFQATAEDALTDDRVAATSVAARMRHADRATVLTRVPSPSDAMSLFAACDLVVAMRLHGVILGATACTPVVALAYDPKLVVVMEQLGLADFVVDLAHADADTLYDRMSAALASREQIRDRLAAATPLLAEQARAAVAAIAALLDGTPASIPQPSEEWWGLLGGALLERLSAVAATPASPAIASLADPPPPHAVNGSNDLAQQLEERTSALAALGAELSAAQTLLARRPGYEYRQLKRTIRSFVREATRSVGWFLGLVLGPVRWLAVAITRLLLPLPARRALGRWLDRGLMSPHAYVFDLFKRERIATYGRSLALLRTSAEPGLVSVVLPAHNGAALISESIESVLAQTYGRFELVVVDDGSDDDTLAIARAYGAADPRVRVVAQEHRQLPATLSHGFRLARGEFLTWTSCDNRMKPEFLERLVACLQRHPDWDMAYANLDIIGEDGRALRNTTYYDPYQRPARSEHIHFPDSTSELNIRANNSVGAAFLYRSRVSALLGDYSPHRFVMEDYDYWMRVNAFLTLRHADVDEPVYEYRFHSQSLTSRWDEFDMLGNRERMMVFDEFRRDVCLSPMVWVIEADDSAAAHGLEQCVRGAGHIVYSGGFDLAALPESGAPLVYVRVTRDPSVSVVRHDIPAHALRVLVADTPAPPDAVDESWDMCVAVAQGASLPPLSSPSRGWFSTSDSTTLFQAVDVRAKSAWLARFESLAEAGEAPTRRASVVICTREFSERLREAIRSVAQQQLDAGSYELIVVDNDPERGGVRIGVESLRNEFFGRRVDDLRLVACAVPGLSFARNAGLAAARGGVVCFLDDDVVAEPDWLAKVCDGFERHPRTGVVGGHIRLKVPEPRPSALRKGWERYWSEYVTEFTEFTEVDDWRKFPWGANWSARRDVLRRIGGFRSRYGRVGTNFWGGEELVAACVVKRLGFSIAVAPTAVVTHNVDPSRFTIEHVRRTITAGRLVGYVAERDLYLPSTGGPGELLGRALALRLDRSVSPLSSRWLDAVFWKLAYGRLLLVAAGDFFRRWRRPISAAR